MLKNPEGNDSRVWASVGASLLKYKQGEVVPVGIAECDCRGAPCFKCPQVGCCPDWCPKPAEPIKGTTGPKGGKGKFTQDF